MIYVCDCYTGILLNELRISLEHRCIALASAFWCATPVLKSRVNSWPQSSQSAANSDGGFVHSDFNRGKQAQNDAERYKAITIYPYHIYGQGSSGQSVDQPQAHHCFQPYREVSFAWRYVPSIVQQHFWGNYIDGCIHCQGQAWNASTKVK